MRIPFETTKVPVDQSINDIIALLEGVGFEDILQGKTRGSRFIIAKQQNLEFKFEMRPK